MPAGKPYGYYLSAVPQFDRLVHEYGDRLEKLTRWDKIQIMLTMAVLVANLDSEPESTLQEAIEDAPLATFSDEAFAAIQCLRGIDQDSAISLIQAITHDI